MKLSQAIYEARRAALDELVGNVLLDQEAKARGLDRAALSEQEIGSKVPAVSEAEVGAWYQANQARVQGATLDRSGHRFARCSLRNGCRRRAANISTR